MNIKAVVNGALLFLKSYVLPIIKPIINILKTKFTEAETEIKAEVKGHLIDYDLERADQRAKKALNQIAVKLVLYIKFVKENKHLLPSNFVTCTDLTILYEYISKGFTGRAMHLALNLIEIEALEHTIRKNKNTIQQKAGDSTVTSESIDIMKEILERQESLLATLNSSKDRIKSNYERQQKEIDEKKS